MEERLRWRARLPEGESVIDFGPLQGGRLTDPRSVAERSAGEGVAYCGASSVSRSFDVMTIALPFQLLRVSFAA